MAEEDLLIRDLREHYRIIHDWHRENGVQEYKKRYEGQLKPDDEWFRKYVCLLGSMPSPEVADLESIGRVADEVRCGCMEWSYWVVPKANLHLSGVAAYILDALEKHSKKRSRNEVQRTLKNLRNIGREGSVPTTVEIVVPEEDMGQPGTYFRYAAIAYGDAVAPEKCKNLGGMVALSDTNLEHEHREGRKSQRDNEGTLIFRNARAMHFIEEEAKESLICRVKAGDIEIESVRIGRGG